MPRSRDRRRASQAAAYNYARLRGLSRAQAKQYSSTAQVDRALEREAPVTDRSGVTNPTLEHLEALRNEPYHYRVRITAGPTREQVRYMYVTVTSPVPLTVPQILARAQGFGAAHGFYVYDAVFLDGVHWEV